MVRGVFITIEGGEGTGKSTQVARLAELLRDAGLSVTVVREPGGTRVGEAVREILLDRVHAGLDARAELMLYEASRAQLVREVLMPALVAGGVVVCDRFTDSTTAYQGYGRGLPLCEVASLNRFATTGLEPDLTIVLDLDVVEGLGRAVGPGGADRLEAEEIEFHERVRDGFHRIAAEEPARVRVLEAVGTVDEVAARIREVVEGLPVLGAVLH